MEESYSCEADSHSTSEEIPRLSWIPNVHYRIHKIPPLGPIQSQMRPVHTFPIYLRSSPFSLTINPLGWWMLDTFSP
jgi:hypothetical protein